MRFSEMATVLATVSALILCACIFTSQEVKTLSTADFPFRNVSLSWEDRVQDLVDRLSLDDLTAQLANGGGECPGVPSLGINPYHYGTECLRGAALPIPSTSFPQALGLAATFSTEVIFNVSRATALELRSRHNNMTSQGNFDIGASCWSPVINIMRDPRWGRNQETWGEDPFLISEFTKWFVHGLQDNNPRYILTNAGCKHFAAYAGPENIPTSRHRFDAKVAERDFQMSHLRQFKACVEAGSYSIMCSYNSINGIPACANQHTMTTILRQQWGFKGYVVSDEGAIEDVFGNYNYTQSVGETAAVCIKAGCNIEIGPVFGLPPFYKGGIPAAVKQGLLDITTLRNTAKPMFYTRMRLGEFDPPEMNPFSKLRPEDYVQSKAHQELAIETAMRSFVLLKNQKNLLPFKKGKVFDTIAVIGPMADDLDALYGDYTSQADQNYGSTPRQGLGPMAHEVVYAAGCADATTCTKYNSTSVSLATQMAQLTVVCLGTGILIEAESNDRVDLSLPGKQLQLLQDVVKAADGNPIIVLLFNAGPLDVSWAQAHPGIHTIMACFFPSQATGAALYRTFYNQGRMANPAGRLPSTWYASIDQVPAITNYSMADRTYRYSSQDFLYPFGYGLSFTNFTYIDVSLNTTVLHAGGAIEVTIILRNTGGLDGEEVIQMYVSWHAPSIPVPKLQLVGFTRDFIPKGQTKKIIMIITYNQLAVWQDNKGFVTLPGTMKLFAGGQQPNQKMKASSNILLANFTVT